MSTAFLAILLAFTTGQHTKQVSDTQKADFIRLLKTLPVKGEFYTNAAVKKAGPYLPVLFALTEDDIKGYDLYPFIALSRGLCDQKKRRDYAVRHFAEIRHPTIKLFWAVMLFDAGVRKPEIVLLLKDALKSEAQAELLSEALGPGFGDFKKRVEAYPKP